MLPSMEDSPQTSLAEIKAAGRRWGLEEFVGVVNGLVERYLPASRSLNVKLRDAFNPRLVRYYATFGLISPPEREGKEARYTYGHLLQALAIRRMLFEGFTAPALLKMFAGKREADYEAMLAGGISVVGAASRKEADEHAAATPPEGLRLVRDLVASEEPLVSASTAPLWRRVEVAPGLELQLRADFTLPEARAGRESLLLAMWQAVASSGQAT